MADIYIRGGWIITMDPRRRIIRDGAVAVEDGYIKAVGKREALDKDYRYHSDIVIDAQRDIVLPGLINTHVHLAQGLLRGCADYLPLIPWLKDRVWPLQGNYKPEEALVSAQLVVAEMLRTGATTFLETGLVGRYGPDNIIEFLHKSGIRAAVARHVMDMTGYALEENILHEGLVELGDISFNDTIRLYHEYHGWDDRIWIWFGPRTPGAVSVELYRKISEKARDLNTGITMHLAEVKADVEYTMAKFGKRPVEFAHWVGLTGPNVVLVHVVWASDEEIKLLAKTKTTVSHNPCCNMKLASGAARISDMLREGVNVALGTDGGPSNNDYDLLREMKHAALLQPLRTLDAKAVRAEQILEAATINGAKALMIDKMVGSIEVGKKADIIVVDYWQPHLKPLNNPISHLVYSAMGSDVKHSIIDGKLVMFDRKILTFNVDEVLEKADKAAHDLYERAGICVEPDTIWPIE
ncbi:amidohydrolase family protein [Staphylothermus hellenicus]|uniref:Amidohydrolase n=1 Tax=Staphylothermus hellenicus (strain DSM 12710 / JCM 10830 / BK20S6-10-b1 / P8) TaxID=591019 RepID=D7DBK4_STAHD|nr:amidohydrolase [Staphylothermus hellenicus]ADI31551.1 amidohydrolase [Staphylothermus hellenicus DSM 12710]